MPTLLYLVCRLEVVNQHIKFGCQGTSGTVVQKIWNKSTFHKVLTLHCDLDLENNNLTSTQNIPANDYVPSNQILLQKDKLFSRYGKAVIFDYMSPHCDLELEESKPICSHDTQAHDDTSQYQVWLQKVQQLSSRWTFTGILNLSCVLDLDHNRAIQSFHKIIKLMMMGHQNQV